VMVLGDLIIIGGLVIFGFVTLLAGMLHVLGRLIGWTVGGNPAGRRRRGGCRAPTYDRPVCPNERCGYVNVPRARYCARCGHPLPDTDIDDYG
jgi:hypothetical protein